MSCNLQSAYYDLDQSVDISQLEVAGGTPPEFSKGYQARYDVQQNQLYLLSRDGSTWLGPCTPGTRSKISNGKFKLDCLQTTVSQQGRLAVYVTWVVKGSIDTICTDMSYLRALDIEGHDSGWVIP
jgi:hypothetical protein